MNFFVAITDWDWFQLHASKSNVDEVNFWRPSSAASFKALHMGEPLLFKLHAPRNFIVGGGFFTKFLTLPVSLAWDAFGEGNGARSLGEVKQRISKYRRTPISTFADPNIGCIILAELEAAHIGPYATGGTHELSNGLCLRSDLHKLCEIAQYH